MLYCLFMYSEGSVLQNDCINAFCWMCFFQRWKFWKVRLKKNFFPGRSCFVSRGKWYPYFNRARGPSPLREWFSCCIHAMQREVGKIQRKDLISDRKISELSERRSCRQQEWESSVHYRLQWEESLCALSYMSRRK